MTTEHPVGRTRLITERRNAGLSARAAAEQIGVKYGVLDAAERTGSVPHPGNAKLIADFYGCKVTDIWPVDLDEAA